MKINLNSKTLTRKLGLIAVLAAAWLLCHAGFAIADVTMNVYVDSMSLNYTKYLPESDPDAMWYQVEHWASAAEARVQNGTFVDMSNTAYPGTTNYSIYDSILTTSGTTGVGKALVWLFDLNTDAAMSSVQIRMLPTDIIYKDGVTTVYSDIDGSVVTNIDSAAWQSIYSATNYPSKELGPLAAGEHVYEGWWTYWDMTGSADWWPYVTGSSFYVEYSTNSGATWSNPASLTANVVPEPGTLTLLGLAGLSGLAMVWIRRRRLNG
jgi:hypothetical protein